MIANDVDEAEPFESATSTDEGTLTGLDIGGNEVVLCPVKSLFTYKRNPPS